MIRSNASQVMRQLSKISSVELMRRCGSAIKDEIEDAFDELLEETAQYTGSTVASYRIGLGANVEDTYDQLPDPGGRPLRQSRQPVAPRRVLHHQPV